jgi:polysaccharide export outer membrane protein
MIPNRHGFIFTTGSKKIMLRNIIVFMAFALMCFQGTQLLWAADADVHASLETVPVSGNAGSVLQAPADKPVGTGYLIGPGDVLDISVWKDEALTRSCVVRPDGFISFPLIGEMQAAGRTVSQLKSDLEGKLSHYVPDVTLSLEVKQINSLIIYVIGKVNNPGRFILNVDTNVLQALATAGGLNIFANRNQIKILRHGSNETRIYPFEYDEVISGKSLEQNIHLERGDVVVVP